MVATDVWEPLTDPTAGPEPHPERDSDPDRGGEPGKWAGWARAMLVPLALAGALVFADLSLTRIYNGPLAAELLAGAAVAAVAVSVLARRLPAWSVAPLSVLALGGYTLLAVRLAAAGGGIPGPLPQLAQDALRNGIPRLLTATIPIEVQPDTIVVPVIATWLAGLAGAELATRARRVLFGYAPAVLLYAGVLYLVGPNAVLSVWQPLGFAACAAAGLAASADSAHVRIASVAALTRAERTRLRLRVAAGAAAGLVVVVGLIGAVGPQVAAMVAHRPSDPRQYVTPPQLDSLDENPLARLSGWAVEPDQELFRVQLSGNRPDTAVSIRLAVLSDYDGVTWRVGGNYRSAGRVLTGPAGQPAPGAPNGVPVTQKITIDQLDGRLLPAMAVPQRVDGVRIAFDSATGTVALPDGLHPGLAYTVVSQEPPQTDASQLFAADVPSGPDTARFLSLGTSNPGPQLRQLADQLATGTAAPYQRALALAEFLATHYPLDNHVSGHALPNLEHFLFGLPGNGGKKGTSEQFAAAFAVLGRMMGLPTRVAVGFHAEGGIVHARDAYAWPQVLFSGLGWVSFNPLPEPNTAQKPLGPDFKPKPPPSAPPPTVLPTLSVSVGPSGRKPSAAALPTPQNGTVSTAVTSTGGGLFLAVLLGAAAVLALRRAQRRRRLYRGPPAERVTGAWREVHDALRLAGRPAPVHLSATELAGYAAQTAQSRPHRHTQSGLQLPAPPLDDLAELLNVAAYAPHSPAENDARHAATQAVAYIDDLRSRMPWWRRLLWTLDPRPLRWSRRRQP